MCRAGACKMRCYVQQNCEAASATTQGDEVKCLIANLGDSTDMIDSDDSITWNKNPVITTTTTAPPQVSLNLKKIVGKDTRYASQH